MLPEPTAHHQLLPDLAVPTKEVRPQAAVEVTAAVALHLHGVTHRVVQAAPEAAGPHLLRHPHQAGEDNLMVATFLSINKKAI